MAASSPRMTPDDRRRVIIEIAREIFLTEGYAAASMSAIASRLGGSKGTLYNYFPSKEALFAEFMRLECEVEGLLAHELGDGETGDIAAALAGLGRRMVNFVFSEKAQAIHRLVIAEAGRFPELGRVFYETGPHRGLTKLSGHLEGWMDQGLLKRADPFRAAQQFSELCKAGLYQKSLWALSTPTEAEIEQNVDEAVAIFLAYYRL